jgi:hypothetical protein
MKVDYSLVYSRAYNEAILKGWMLQSQVDCMLEEDPENTLLQNYPSVEKIAQMVEDCYEQAGAS